jgi:hypothetical protein
MAFFELPGQLPLIALGQVLLRLVDRGDVASTRLRAITSNVGARDGSAQGVDEPRIDGRREELEVPDRPHDAGPVDEADLDRVNRPPPEKIL